MLRRLAEVVKWPFERLAWAIERGLLWPLTERTGKWSPSLRIAGAAALALLAVAAGALGLSLASGGQGGTTTTRQAAVPSAAPAAVPSPELAPAAAAPVLQGAKPDFATEADGGVAPGSAGTPPGNSGTTANSTAEVARSTPPSPGQATSGEAHAKSPGPAALKVARQFSGAFVLYEVGNDPARVRKVFGETATPQVTHALLQREPRQPAGAEVPQAKVLNVVPGPLHGDTYTLSVSLLRVGVTSELRLTMQRDEKTGEWQVTDVLG